MRDLRLYGWTYSELAKWQCIWLDMRRTAQETLRVDSPGGGGKPQEIDGKDGVNPSLCRNRVVPGAE